MTTHIPRRRSRRQPPPTLISDRQRDRITRQFPLWFFAAILFALLLPQILYGMVDMVKRGVPMLPGIAVGIVQFNVDTVETLGGWMLDGADGFSGVIGTVMTGISGLVDDDNAGTSGQIAPLFTREIAHWEDDIMRWSTEYDLDPNLLATVMQIESCGHPTVSSSAGAQGLFQVMPFHFGSAEDQLDPDTNALRGAGVLNACLDMANGDAGMAMACYNGGPSVLYNDYSTWLAEPQRYYRWGTGIYGDAQQDSGTSGTLDAWLAAGGATLCQMASNQLGIN